MFHIPRCESSLQSPPPPAHTHIWALIFYMTRWATPRYLRSCFPTRSGSTYWLEKLARFLSSDY